MAGQRLLDGRLKLRHLILLEEIADRGSLVAAARALYMTQPVLTRALQDVERILGVPLFDRRPHGVTPTMYGEVLVAHARSVLAQLRQADSRIAELERADAGQIVVGTHLFGSNLVLPTAIARLKESHPRLVVVVREASPEVLRDAVAAGEADLMVGRLVAQPPDGLVQERLYLESILLMARNAHPAHRMIDPTLADLSGFPWIFPIAQTSLRDELEETFLLDGAPIPENRVECTWMPTLRQLLVSTDTIAVLPALVAKDHEMLAEIKVRSEALPRLRRAVGVTTARHRPPAPGSIALMAQLRNVVRELEPD